MKFLKVLVVILLIAANGVILFFATAGGEGIPPIGSLEYPGSYPDFGAEAITFAPEDTHTWDGAIDGGINGSASDVEKAIYLFLLACYNERDLPYYSYYLPGTGGTNMGDDLQGDMVSQSYRVVNNTIGDNELVYHRLINYVIDGRPESLLPAIRSIPVFGEAYQKVYYNDTQYKMIASPKKVSIISEPEEDIVLGASWKYNNIETDDYDGKVDDYEDIDTAGMTEDEIEFAYRYESRISVDLLVDNIIDAEESSLEYITEGDNSYWEGKLVVDIDVANADQTTLDNLADATGGLASSFKKFELSFQIWDIGVFKFFNAEESWNGQVLHLTGFSESEAPCYYSYNSEDCDLTDLFAEFDLDVPTE